jgi:alpha-galactosidase-like protein/gametolysin peptidase M11
MGKRICPPRIYRSILVLGLLLSLRPTSSPAQTAPRNTETPAAARMRALNNSLLHLHGQMQQAGPNDVASLHSQAANVIAQRAAALSKLIQNDTHAALSFAFSPELLGDLAAKFPQSASLLESHATLTGQVQHWIADYPGLKSSRSIWRMNAGGRALNLYFAGQEPTDLKSDQLLQATGVVSGSQMAVETSILLPSSSASSLPLNSGSLVARASHKQQWPMFLSLICALVFSMPGLGWEARAVRGRALAFLKQFSIFGLVFVLAICTSTPLYAQNSCSTKGVQNTVVLMVNLPNGTLPVGVTQAAMQDVFFASNTPGASLDGFLREASYGQASATGGVFGPFNLTGTYTSCTDVGGAILNDAIAAAVASGVNLNNYTRVFLVFPDIFGCGWAGFASNSCTIASSSGTFSASVAFLAARYATPRDQGAQVASHEIGHNLGLLHSGTIAAGTDALGPVSSPGSVTDMGDYWSTLGAPALGLYPAPQKAEVTGWMVSGTNFQTVSSSGTYTLEPLEVNPPGLQALKVERGTGNNAWLWIEYRQPLGSYDSTLFSQPFSGALIHYEDSTTPLGHTYLPNFTPSDTSGNSPALAAGQTWTDPYSNLSLSVLSATSSGLTVNVNYGAAPCTPANPTVTVSPLDPSIYAGNSAVYTLSISNNDSSGCSSTTFGLGSTQPPNWPTSFSANSVTLNPGQSASATMYKMGPSGTPAGTYAVDASAANNAYVGSGKANVTVMAAPTLTASVTVPASSYTLRSTVPITASVMNGGVPASGASVTFTLTAPNGSTTTQTVTTGPTGTATWSYKTSSRSAPGTYVVSGQATLTSGSKRTQTTQSATSNTATFTLQ